MNSDLRVCPICGYSQSRGDPTGHVCASRLRETVRSTRAELDGARETIAALERSLAASERYGRAAHARGFASALRVVLALLAKLPASRWLLARTLRQLATEERQAMGQANQ